MSNPIHDCIDQLLLEQGSYTPLDFLLAEGRLDYGDYEAWRSGHIPRLEEMLFGDPEQISQMLDQAKAYAIALKLEPELLAYSPWGSDSNNTLSFSQHPAREQCFHTKYGKSEDRPQLDLFMDATAGSLANRIAQALINRDNSEAQRLLQRLLEADPGHPRLGALERLVAAEQQLHCHITDAVKILVYIQDELTPLAEEELGPASHNLLVPHWRHLTAALHEVAFDPQHPRLHASYTAGRAFDWRQVVSAIQSEAGWQQYPLLLWRYAKAHEHLHDKPAALLAYFQLCWHFPDEANGIGAQAALPLQQAWEDFLALEPELPNELFPAWYLMSQPGLVHQLPQPDCAQQTTSGQAYQVIYGLQQKTRPGSASLNETSIPLRRELKQLSPALFTHYMQTQR